MQHGARQSVTIFGWTICIVSQVILANHVNWHIRKKL
jgi:hypothetical protein